MKLLLAVAIGGALGSVARHLWASRVTHWVGPASAFPWGILSVNIAGSAAMGVLVELMALRWSLAPETRTFLTTGILGGFTTFSTFSLDLAVMIERGDFGLAGLYAVLSVALGVAGLFAGMAAMRGLLA